MRRAFVSALLLSAISAPACYGTAWAGPLQLTLDHAPPLDQNGTAEPQPQPQQRSAQTQSDLGQRETGQSPGDDKKRVERAGANARMSISKSHGETPQRGETA